MAHIENFWLDSSSTDKTTRKSCCGCTACESICSKKAISMKADKEGFMYPVVNKNYALIVAYVLKFVQS